MQNNKGIGAIHSLGYVIVLCDDLDRMVAFYKDLFGFAVEEVAGHLVSFRVGGVFLALRSRGRGYDGAGGPGASVQLSFRVPPADVDRAYETLQAQGVGEIEPPTDQDWTHRTLFFRDPEQNILEIFADIHPDQTLDAPTGMHLLAP